ncbi:MAG: SDR family oxidoreductase [Micrococcaceae bacterium]|nr:SDR family oxidoreductase [Micrococcaceae bacterium]
MTVLKGGHWIVVGATGGLGSAISRILAQEGARLTLSGRNQDKLEALAQELGGAVVGTIRADLSIPAGPAAIAAAAQCDTGVDGIIYAAGVVAFGPLGELDDDTFDEVLLLDFVAPVRLLREMLPQLNAGSVVVHLSAVVAETPMKNMAVYSAAKAALSGFSTAMGAELRRHKVRVLDVRPPHTDTGLHTRPVAGQAPPLGTAHGVEAVARRIVQAITDEEKDLPAAAFTDL